MKKILLMLLTIVGTVSASGFEESDSRSTPMLEQEQKLVTVTITKQQHDYIRGFLNNLNKICAMQNQQQKINLTQLSEQVLKTILFQLKSNKVESVTDFIQRFLAEMPKRETQISKQDQKSLTIAKDQFDNFLPNPYETDSTLSIDQALNTILTQLHNHNTNSVTTFLQQLWEDMNDKK